MLLCTVLARKVGKTARQSVGATKGRRRTGSEYSIEMIESARERAIKRRVDVSLDHEENLAEVAYL